MNRQKNRRMRMMALVVAVLAAGSLLLAQDSPFVGTWKLNVAKSKYNPGPAPQSQTRTWDAMGMVMVNGVNAAGKQMSYGYTIKDDGKEYATMGAIPNTADKISSKKVDANTFEATFTKAGSQVETTTFKVSDGGKTLTIHAKGKTPAGEFDNLQFWEKQ
jgi:cytochrome c-type biogenesis protein CcmE